MLPEKPPDVKLAITVTYSKETLGFTFLGNFFAFGYTGVDFFFVLSGFIIFYAHHRDIGQRSQLRPYMLKRCIRVYPIYWIVTTVKVVAILLIPAIAKSYEQNPSVIIKSYLLVPQVNLPIIGAAWTLSYEMLFYLVFGLAIWSGSRWAIRLFALWGVLIMGLAVGQAGRFLGTPGTPAIQFLLNERNLEFMMGCLGAYVVLHYRPKYQGLMLAGGIILCVLAANYVRQGYNVPSHALMFGAPSLLIVTGSALLEARHVWRVPQMLVSLGDASYSLYLTHVLFINVLLLVLAKLGLLRQFSYGLLTLIMMGWAIAGASMLYWTVEKPLLSHLRRTLISRSANTVAKATVASLD